MSDNHIDWPDYGAPETPTGDQINIIAADGEPHILRNVATYYAAKEEPWADGLAERLRKAANDNERAIRRIAA